MNILFVKKMIKENMKDLFTYHSSIILHTFHLLFYILFIYTDK